MRATVNQDGRRVTFVNLRVDEEAVEILKRCSPSPKTRGRFVARLLYEHQARLDERERIAKQLTEVVSSGDAA